MTGVNATVQSNPKRMNQGNTIIIFQLFYQIRDKDYHLLGRDYNNLPQPGQLSSYYSQPFMHFGCTRLLQQGRGKAFLGLISLRQTSHFVQFQKRVSERWLSMQFLFTHLRICLFSVRGSWAESVYFSHLRQMQMKIWTNTMHENSAMQAYATIAQFLSCSSIQLLQSDLVLQESESQVQQCSPSTCLPYSIGQISKQVKSEGFWGAISALWRVMVVAAQTAIVRSMTSTRQTIMMIVRFREGESSEQMQVQQGEEQFEGWAFWWVLFIDFLNVNNTQQYYYSAVSEWVCVGFGKIERGWVG